MNSLPSYLAGVATTSDRWIDVFNPWNKEQVGRVTCISGEQLDAATHASDACERVFDGQGDWGFTSRCRMGRRL